MVKKGLAFLDETQWLEHIAHRSDMSSRLTHLTKRTEKLNSIEVLFKILEEKTLIGTGQSGYIRNNKRAVCFQDVPLYSIAENIKFE